jgi:2'-5' RNA ligase
LFDSCPNKTLKTCSCKTASIKTQKSIESQYHGHMTRYRVLLKEIKGIQINRTIFDIEFKSAYGTTRFKLCEIKFSKFSPTNNFDHRADESISMVLTELQLLQF